MPNLLVLKKDKGFYRIPLLEKFQVRGFITTRDYNMAFEDDFGVSSRRQAYEAMEVSGHEIVCPNQVHGDGIFFTVRAQRGCGGLNRITAIDATDAFVTDARRLPMGILTADCLPIFILDKNRKAMALIHAGWRGIEKLIISKTVYAMVSRLSVKPSELLVVVGPSIRPCCYEVGEEFLQHFDNFLIWRGKKIYFDLQEAAMDQLVASGIRKDAIYDSLICTSCHNNEFFSYRKEGSGAGRSMFLVEML